MNIKTALGREHMQPGVYIVSCNEKCAQRELMKCVHVTMNSEYPITIREDQFVCYIMLATVRYINRSSHATQSSTCALQLLALVNLCLSFLPHANFVINGNCNKIVRYHDFISHIHITLRPIG